MTPEGKVKEKVKALLKRFDGVWYYMPVSLGMGAHGIPDFVCCFRGMSFFIETKAPGKKLTALQLYQRRSIAYAGGAYFTVRGDDDIDFVRRWLDRVNLGEIMRFVLEADEECEHENLNDYGDACLDCGAVWFEGEWR